MKLQGTDAF